MAEESDLEKTEPASPRKLEKAREEGDVPRSRELATCTLLLGAGAAFWFTGGSMINQINTMLSSGLSFNRDMAFDMNLLLTHTASQIIDLLIAFLPAALILIVVALASPMLIGGWLFSAKALQPNFARMNPIKGLGNMVSTRAAVELGKAIGKTLLVGCIAYTVIRFEIDAVMALSVESLKTGAEHLGHLMLLTFTFIASGLIIIAAVDAPYQMWQHAKKLMMTRQEVRQEAKESDGNPEIKAKIRQTQRAMARRRMMTEIPTADVVVTNPTHFAVALKYSENGMRAPKVVAKGADEVAAKIREIAIENNVVLLEAPPLARALFRHTELGDEIPEGLYVAVAEVLAYVFQLRAYSKHGGQRPQKPVDLDVPPQMDPLNPAAQNGTKQ
ncbi:MAG: flagellar biosynthesis protein FlhB [Oxalicibacterium faecigallinarum]|uniref:Flagellar biosynthetic protein FlhB n=1 Tax=Oxalicibacterium faecigallinarum TaxID=573741 RepID=A0A8J3F0F1_9BURK|nr:flagellar biosynthesis protein FlhB [Oxalicibacterium faecigallinarum]MDQ7970078.1 flagellar biosynthesis protein FlhB [Oxalicibacterium faecigallinarum]GGI16252.1 flagellar biosynthesis protein FlhB [Oxalicibacterium faecigallinarum]